MTTDAGAPPPANPNPGDGAPPPPAAAGTTVQRPDWLSENDARFFDEKEGVKADAIYKSYSEMQGLLGRRVTDLNEAQRRALYDAIPDEVRTQYGKELRASLAADEEFLKPLKEGWEASLPKAPDAYELPAVEGFEFDRDAPLMGQLDEFAKTHRLSQEDYTTLIGFATELLGNFVPPPMEERMKAAGPELEQRAKAVANRTRGLVAHIVGPDLVAQEKARANVEALLSFLPKSPEAFEGLELLLKATGEKQLPGGGIESQPELTQEALVQMQRDPKYWRDREPGFVRRVHEGYERLFGPGARI